LLNIILLLTVIFCKTNTTFEVYGDSMHFVIALLATYHYHKCMDGKVVNMSI